jgi:hypothetical protein
MEETILILFVPATRQLGYNNTAITSRVPAKYNRTILRDYKDRDNFTLSN